MQSLELQSPNFLFWSFKNKQVKNKQKREEECVPVYIGELGIGLPVSGNDIYSLRVCSFNISGYHY